MNYNILVPAVALVVFLLYTAVVLKREAVKAIMVSVSVIWSCFFALHFWGVGISTVINFTEDGLNLRYKWMIGLWITFIFAMVISFVIMKFFKNMVKDGAFPAQVNQLLSTVLTLVSAVLITSFFVVTISLSPNKDFKVNKGALSKIFHSYKKLPLKIYVNIANQDMDMDNSELHPTARMIKQFDMEFKRAGKEEETKPEEEKEPAKDKNKDKNKDKSPKEGSNIFKKRRSLDID